MVPKLLTENLCSLRSEVDRLAFTVLWEFDRNTLKPVKIRFAKSMIRSVASLTYYEAQDMIDDKNDNKVLTKSLRLLLNLARHLRDGRI
jgi:exosome complex exonuclease DIS3/RRP44